MSIKKIILTVVFSFSPFFVFAEGTSELGIQQALRGAADNSPSILFVDIIDANQETVTWTGTGNVTLTDPAGANLGTFPSGSTITPTLGLNGAYKIELDSDQNTFDGDGNLVGLAWDITVNNPVSPGGRLYSLSWNFNSGSYDQPHATSTSFYGVGSGGDGTDTVVIELKLDGLSGFIFEIMANDSGVEGISPSRSVFQCSGQEAPDPSCTSTTRTATPQNKLYLNPPTLSTYTAIVPIVDDFKFSSQTLSAAQASAGTCSDGIVPGTTTGVFTFSTNISGSYRIVCDINGDGLFDLSSSTDLALQGKVVPGNNSVSWDGSDNNGNFLKAGEYPCETTLSVGEFHFVGRDIETSYRGLRLFQVNADASRTPLNMFWNDSEVQESDVLMPNGFFGLESSGPDGISSGPYTDPPDPNVNARAWGNFNAEDISGGNSKGNITFLDTFAFAKASEKTSIVIPIQNSCEPIEGGGFAGCQLSKKGTIKSLGDTPIVLFLFLFLLGGLWLLRARLKIMLLLFLLAPQPLLALNVQILRPSTGAVKGFHLYTSETLPAGRLATGLMLNWDHQPFEVATSTSAGKRKRGIVDDFLTMDVLLSYGIGKRLTVSADLPVNLYFNIAPEFIPTRAKGVGDIGDLKLDVKYQFLNADTTRSRTGLGVVSFLTLPTGKQDHHFGESFLTGGLVVVGDLQAKSNRLYLNLGTRFRKKEALRNLILASDFLYGFGLQRPLWKRHHLDIIIETSGSTTYRRFFSEQVSSPLELYAVLQKKWYRECRGQAPPSPAEFLALKGLIHFETDRAIIRPESYGVLTDVARQLNDHPEIKRAEVQGHTDSDASVPYNQDLSNRRSASVRRYLIELGIQPERLTAVGYGELQPIDTNTTPEGKAHNRRVMMKILERSAPATVKILSGCRDPKWIFTVGGGGLGLLRGYGTSDWRGILGISYVFP